MILSIPVHFAHSYRPHYASISPVDHHVHFYGAESERECSRSPIVEWSLKSDGGRSDEECPEALTSEKIARIDHKWEGNNLSKTCDRYQLCSSDYASRREVFSVYLAKMVLSKKCGKIKFEVRK